MSGLLNATPYPFRTPPDISSDSPRSARISASALEGSSPAIPVGTRPQGVAAADLNNDGRPELVVAHTASLLSSDADMHRLTYEWRENGRVLGYGVNFWPGRLTPGPHTYELTVRDERGGEAKDTVVWNITHFDEIVIVPAYSDTHGTWQTVQDPTAAENSRIWNPNANAPKLAAPLAAPVNYVDIYFTPDPTREYKLWIRGKADGNSWANDSVFVQFSDSIDNAGNAVYRIGTSSGLAVNLEECAGCGISGWGWEDDGWGAVDKPGVTLRFPNPEWQRIRIQTREDGFSIDQIVLSAGKYKTQRPGTAKNDTTVLERTQW